MKFVTRKEWGARAPRSTSKDISPELGGVAVHWEGPHTGLAWNHDQCASKIRTIQNFHMDTRKWADIAYSAVVCHHGYVFEGRWIGNRTAANGTNDSNNRYYAVCGNFGENDQLTDEMKQGIADAIAELQKSGAAKDVQPHKHFFSTACPGPELTEWIAKGTHTQPSEPTRSNIVNGVNRAQGGYSLVGPDGAVFCYDGAPFCGSLPGLHVKADNVVSMAWTSTGNGYWLMGKDGGIFSFGDAKFHGSYPGLPEDQRQGVREFSTVVCTAKGYTLVSTTNEHYDFNA